MKVRITIQQLDKRIGSNACIYIQIVVAAEVFRGSFKGIVFRIPGHADQELQQEEVLLIDFIYLLQQLLLKKCEVFVLGLLVGIQNLHYLNAQMPSRSEEHTSELQSLMRISYAVF